MPLFGDNSDKLKFSSTFNAVITATPPPLGGPWVNTVWPLYVVEIGLPTLTLYSLRSLFLMSPPFSIIAFSILSAFSPS